MTANDVKAYQFQAKGFETKPYLLRVGNISKRFTAGNMKKKTQFNGKVYSCSVEYITIDISDIAEIHKYLMKRYDIV